MLGNTKKTANKKPKRIGIDARFYGPELKGLGRYTQEVVDNVLALDQDNEYVVFLHEDNFESFKAEGGRVRKIRVKSRWYSLGEQIEMPRLIKRSGLDLMHFLHFNVPLFCPARFVVTIHDLILTRFPTQRATTLSPWLYFLKNQAYKLVIGRAVKKAVKIITVSFFTKKDIVGQFKAAPEKIQVIYEGVSRRLTDPKSGTGQNNDKNVILSYNIHKPFLLYVGNAYPHKNLERLVRVIPKIKENYPNITLVLVGKEDYFYNRLKQYAGNYAKKEEIIFPGFVPDKDLAALYRQAEAYVFPSLYEGFGLPPLEAMRHGCVVASSSASSMPEILGKAALYFDPKEENEILEKISRLLSEEKTRTRLLEAGYRQANKYSWKKCAQDILWAYSNILASPHARPSKRAKRKAAS